MPFRLPTPLLVALLAIAVATLIGLGLWQMRRAEWRATLVATRNAQLAGQPLSAAEARALDPTVLDYRLVTLDGTWDADHVMILANRARYGTKGEQIVQPLIIAPGEAVLVDRGWYPVAQREAALARLRASDTTNTRGLARYVEGLHASKTGAGTWTGIAPQSMAVGLPYRVAPWFVIEGQLLPANAPRPASVPAQGFLPYTSTTPHVQYALTWFGIAAALVVIAIVRFVVEPRRARARAEAAGR